MRTKLLFVVNISDFFISHRLPIALEAIKRGYDVSLISGDSKNCVTLQALQIKQYTVPLSRSGTNPFMEAHLLLVFYRVIKAIKPDIIHTVSIKPVLYVGFLNRLLFKKPIVSAISGMGYLFTKTGTKARLIQSLLTLAYRLAIGGKANQTIVQNSDDLTFFINKRVLSPKQIHLMKGAGVSLNEYSFAPSMPSNNVTVLLPARLLWDKGLNEFFGAAKVLGEKYPCRFVLVGHLDEENPSVINKEILDAWLQYPYIEWLGYQPNMVPIYQQADIICLPSYREGMPRALLEAQACGRPVVTTDVPGCRESIMQNETGLLVESRNNDSLVKALEKLIVDKNLRSKMGRAARIWAEKEFSVEKVVTRTIGLYEDILSSQCAMVDN